MQMKILFIARTPLVPVRTGVQSTATQLISNLSSICNVHVCLVQEAEVSDSVHAGLNETCEWLRTRGIVFSSVVIEKKSTKMQLFHYAIKRKLTGSVFSDLISNYDQIVVFAPCYDSIFEHCLALPEVLRKRIFPYVADSLALAERSRMKNKPSIFSKLRLLGATLIEKTILNGNFNRILYVSRRDFHYSRILSPKSKRAVVNIGVDIVDIKRDYFQHKLCHPIKLCFSGVLNYKPNEDAACELIENIYPLLPQGEFCVRIFGFNPTKRLLSLNKPLTKVIGPVRNIYEALSTCDIFVSCLTTGAGAKNKVLAALAVGLPVIGTEESFSGLNAHIPGAYRVKNSEQILEKIHEISSKSSEQLELISSAAREVIMNKFSWKSRAHDLIKVLKTAND